MVWPSPWCSAKQVLPAMGLKNWRTPEATGMIWAFVLRLVIFASEETLGQ